MFPPLIPHTVILYKCNSKEFRKSAQVYIKMKLRCFSKTLFVLTCVLTSPSEKARMELINALWTENPTALLLSIKCSTTQTFQTLLVSPSSCKLVLRSFLLQCFQTNHNSCKMEIILGFFFLSCCKSPCLLCALNKLFLYNYVDYYSSLIQFYFTTKRPRQQHFQSWTRTFSFHYDD